VGPSFLPSRLREGPGVGPSFPPPARGRGRGWARSRCGRDYDTYGRSLRAVTRAGASLGETLVDEGLAEEWKGYRGSWC
jgi:hypothetical protein